MGITKDLIASFESQAAQPETHMRSQSLVQQRIASFENLKSTDQRPASASAELPARKPASLEPPFSFCPQQARQRMWSNPPLRAMDRTPIPLPDQNEPEDHEPEADLKIDNNELLTMQSRPLPRPRARRPMHARSQTNTISRAASKMYEPEELSSHSHVRSQSVPKTPLAPSGEPRSASPVRLIPANSHPSMFPSAFRAVPEERPGSSCSTSSVTSSGPPTPKSATSPSTSPKSSWLSWFSSPFSSPATSPTTEHAPVISISSVSGATLNPLKPNADDFGFIVRKGINAHWADVAGEKRVVGARTASRRVRWDDEESVKYSWF